MVSIPERYHSASISSTIVAAAPQLSLSAPRTAHSPLRLRNPSKFPAKTSKLLSDDHLLNFDHKKKKRLSIADRLKKIGKELGRFGNHASSTSTSTLTAPSFGNSTNLDSRQSDGETSTITSSSTSTPASVNADNSLNTSLMDGSTDRQLREGPIEPEPEATSLAKDIQNLVDSLPLPHYPSPIQIPHPALSRTPSPYSPEIPLPTETHPTDDSSEPQPQPQLKDSLIALLSNASFMNGSSLKGRPSIWSVLENIHRSPNPNPSSSHLDPTTHNDSETQPLKEDEAPSNIYHNQLSNESSSIFSDTSSIMVYSPLLPTQSDIVELAELVSFDSQSGETETSQVEERSVDGDRDVRSANVGGGNIQEGLGGRTSWTLMWPFSVWYGPDQTYRSLSQTPSLSMGCPGGPERRSAQVITSPNVGTSNNVDTSSPPPQVIRPVRSQRSIRAWVPSSSKISVQAFWWGYRLYLPPPILEILSDRTLEATKRSAVITTALTWFFSNLPVEAFPMPMRPGLILLQRLVPLLGYIGTFISWSWSAIRSYDVGCGVTLTATWILPVALIPGTWHERDFPKSPSPNSPIPLPRPLSFQSFGILTPATDHDVPTGAYATPMSSVVPLPDVALDGENGVLDPSLTSSSSTMSSSPLPPPPLLPISSPMHYPTTIAPIPNIAIPQSQTSTSTLPVPQTLSPSSPQTRFTTRVRSSSPSIGSSSSSTTNIPQSPSSTSTTHPNLTPTPTPIPPTPIELPPIPPEFPFCPKLVNQLLRGPVLQTVPLPDV